MILDLILLICIASGGFYFYRNGFLYYFSSISGYFFGLLFSIMLSGNIFNFLKEKLTISVSEILLSYLSFMLVFLVILYIFKWLIGSVSGVLNAIRLEYIDKLLGFVLGAVATFLFLDMVIMILTRQQFFDVSSIYDGSRIYTLIIKSNEILKNIWEWLKSIKK